MKSIISETNIIERGSATNLSWQEKKISELEDKSIDIIQISKVGGKMGKINKVLETCWKPSSVFT